MDWLINPVSYRERGFLLRGDKASAGVGRQAAFPSKDKAI